MVIEAVGKGKIFQRQSRERIMEVLGLSNNIKKIIAYFLIEV